MFLTRQKYGLSACSIRPTRKISFCRSCDLRSDSAFVSRNTLAIRTSSSLRPDGRMKKASLPLSLPVGPGVAEVRLPVQEFKQCFRSVRNGPDEPEAALGLSHDETAGANQLVN